MGACAERSGVSGESGVYMGVVYVGEEGFGSLGCQRVVQVYEEHAHTEYKKKDHAFVGCVQWHVGNFSSVYCIYKR